MYYNKPKYTKYKVRKQWIKNLLDVTDHMMKVSQILKKYAFYLDENDSMFNINCVNDVIAYILEVLDMFGYVVNWHMDFPECLGIGGVINAFTDDTRPNEQLVKRIMKGIK